MTALPARGAKGAVGVPGSVVLPCDTAPEEPVPQKRNSGWMSEKSRHPEGAAAAAAATEGSRAPRERLGYSPA